MNEFKAAIVLNSRNKSGYLYSRFEEYKSVFSYYMEFLEKFRRF